MQISQNQKTANFRFNADDHSYWYGELRLIGVTETLDKAGLIPSFCKNEERAHFGTVVHATCALDDEGDLLESSVHESVKPRLEAWRKFKAESGFIAEEIEQPCFNLDLGLAGTRDRVGIAFDKPVVIDLKSGTPSPSWGWQLGGYLLLDSKMYWPYSVQLKPDATYSCKSYNLTTIRSVFVAALNVVRAKEELYGTRFSDRNAERA